METGFATGRLLIKDIGHLVGFGTEPSGRLEGGEMRKISVVEDAWLAIEDGRILEGGTMADFPGITDWNGLEVIEADGRVVMPAWVDSHTHLIHAASREGEFVDRIRGLSYQEIAERGGGILNSAKALRSMSEDDLYAVSLERMERLMRMGTGAIEIKSTLRSFKRQYSEPPPGIGLLIINGSFFCSSSIWATIELSIMFEATLINGSAPVFNCLIRCPNTRVLSYFVSHGTVL